MTEVRKHRRQTASGKLTTVRHHTRNTGDGEPGESGEAWDQRMASASAAPQVSSLAPAEPALAEESWWADDGPGADPVDAELCRMQQEMRDWRALGEPELPPEDPADAWLAPTPREMLNLRRLKAYREAGYTGPLDEDNSIPDPDDPANYGWLHAGAALSLTHDRD